MEYGYARCSTNETKQDIDRQVRELKAAGAREIFLEYEHGDAKVKSQQEAMFATAEAGDTIITLEVPRLARSTQQLCGIIDTVREKRLRLVIVGSITLDCRGEQADPMSEAFLQMAGVFSQLELAMIRSRVRSGMANAKAKGRQNGRPQITADSIPQSSFGTIPPIKRSTKHRRIGTGLRHQQNHDLQAYWAFGIIKNGADLCPLQMVNCYAYKRLLFYQFVRHATYNPPYVCNNDWKCCKSKEHTIEVKTTNYYSKNLKYFPFFSIFNTYLFSNWG